MVSPKLGSSYAILTAMLRSKRIVGMKTSGNEVRQFLGPKWHNLMRRGLDARYYDLAPAVIRCISSKKNFKFSGSTPGWTPNLSVSNCFK